MIVCNDLVYQYPKSSDGLAGFTYDGRVLAAGSVCGMLGKNGAGKTTLINIASGALLGGRGACLVHGFDARQRRAEMLQNIAVLPEEYSLPAISARAYEKIWAPFYPAFDSAVFWSLYQAFGCPEGKLLTQLSLGQKKKIMLAFAVATRAKLIILDEPTNGLDIPNKILFKQLIRKHLLPEQCVLISTHQIKDVEGVIDSLLLVDGGRFVLAATLEKLRALFVTEHIFSGHASINADGKNAAASPAASAAETIARALFTMPAAEGYLALRRRTPHDAPDAPLDLEVFFTAAVQDAGGVAAIVRTEEAAAAGAPQNLHGVQQP